MSALINVILLFILAFCPLLGFLCFKNGKRAWATLIVIVMIMDVVVMLYAFNF